MPKLTKAIGVSDGEWPRLHSMAFLFFLLMMGWGFGRAGRDAFFIVEAGPEKLPYVYIINAVLMVGFSILYAKVVDQLRRHIFLVYQLIGFSIAVVTLRLLIPFEFGWMPYAIFSLSEVITLFFFMHFWTYANDIFDPREGKRIFPLVGGAGLMGNVLGSALTKPVVALTGTVDLLIVWVATMLVSIPATLYANRTAEAAGLDSSQNNEEEQLSFRDSLTAVWSIKLIRTLTYLSLPMWLTVYFVDFQFFLAMDEVFTDQDALSGFLGIFNGITSLLGFAIQMLITTRLIKRFGVGTAVLAHPLSVALGSLGLVMRSFFPVVTPRLFTFRGLSAVFAKFSDNALFYSVGESATQLLYNAIPEESRGQSRAFVAGTVEPLFAAVAGIVLILCTLFAVSIQMLAIITFFISLTWVQLTRKVKADYISALVKNLSSLDINIQSAAFAELSRHTDSSSMEILAEAAKSSDLMVARFALDLIRDSGRDDAAETLLNAINSFNEAVLPYVIDTLTGMGCPNLFPAVEPFLNSEDSSVRCAAVRAVTAAGEIDGYRLIQPYLNDPDLTVREEVIGALYLSGNEKRSALAGEAIAALKESDQQQDIITAVRIMGISCNVSFVADLKQFLNSTDRLVIQIAVESLGKLQSEEAISSLFTLLNNDSISSVAEASLVSIGAPAVRILLEHMNEDTSSYQATVRCLVEIRMKSSLDDFQEAGDFNPVVSFLADECDQLQRLMKSKIVLQGLEETGALTLLRGAISDDLASTEESVLNCLQLLADQDTVRAGITSLQSGVPRTMAEGLEVLEGSCPEGRGVVRILEKMHFPDSDTEAEITVPGVVSHLLGGASTPWTKACALFLSGEMKLDVFELIQRFSENNSVWLQANRRLALKKIQQKNEQLTEEEKSMALNMERMLFLRSVPLFRDLSGNDLTIVNDIAAEKSFNRGDLVVEEGGAGDSLYIILDGNMRVVKGKEGGTTLAVLHEREAFGEMSILDDEPRSATVEAQTDARLLEIRQSDFQRLLVARPKMALALFRTLSQRLRKTDEKLAGAKM